MTGRAGKRELSHGRHSWRHRLEVRLKLRIEGDRLREFLSRGADNHRALDARHQLDREQLVHVTLEPQPLGSLAGGEIDNEHAAHRRPIPLRELVGDRHVFELAVARLRNGHERKAVDDRESTKEPGAECYIPKVAGLLVDLDEESTTAVDSV